MLLTDLYRVLRNPWGADLKTWLFLVARSTLTPYRKASRFVPQQGRVLDMGCGHGLFSLLLSSETSRRQIVAVDHDAQRLALATRALKHTPNCEVRAGSMLGEWSGPFRAILIFDALHYLSPKEQQRVIGRAYAELEPGGVLLAREVDRSSGLISRLNQGYEKLATRLGFTKSASEDLSFRARSEWTELFEGHGFSTYSTPCTSPLFSDILFVCRKPGVSAATEQLPFFTADDWGMSPAINRGILHLAKLGIVKRVSLMANAAYVSLQLDALLAVPGLSLGLHWDRTSHAGSPFSVFTSRGNPAEELRLQLLKLKQLGVPVTYLDSHHHVHLLPGIIDAIAPVLHAHGISTVRLPYDPALWVTRKFPLNVMSLLARRALKRNALSSLPCRYPQRVDFLDQERLRTLSRESPDAEIIVHPADSDDLGKHGSKDSYRIERVLEFQALCGLA